MTTPQMNTPTTPTRRMGFWAVLGMVISLQLGSAMFLLPSQLSPYGFWSIVSWVITGSGALSLCYLFSVLAHHSPRRGGPHVYVDEAFGKSLGFYVGWSYWVISWLSSIPLVVLAATSLEHLIGDQGPLFRLAIEATILFFIATLNLRGAEISGFAEIFFSSLKVVPLIIIPLLSIPFWKMSYVAPPSDLSPLTALNAASLLTFWGFVGLEAGTTVMDCVENSPVIVPRALFWGTLLVILIYILNTTMIMAVLPINVVKTSTNPYSALLSTIGYPFLGKGIALFVFIMCVGTLNSWLLASGQIAMVAAKEKIFPPFFGKTNANQSPASGIILTTFIMFILLILLQNKTIYDQIKHLINLSTFLFIAIYFCVVLSLIKLKMQKKIKGGFLSWLATGMAFSFCSWSLFSTEWIIILGAMIIPLIGFFVSWLGKWSKEMV